MFWHISYISIATAAFSEGNLSQLEANANATNCELGITGMLVYDGSHFFQYLEGDKSSVSELYEKIKKDHRHRDVTTLSEGPLLKQLFSGWGMKSFLPSQFVMEDRVHILDILSHKHEKDTIPSILEGLRTRREA